MNYSLYNTNVGQTDGQSDWFSVAITLNPSNCLAGVYVAVRQVLWLLLRRLKVLNIHELLSFISKLTTNSA